MELDVDYRTVGDENSFRRIKYTFSEDVLRLPLIGTSLTFKVGPAPLPSFRMIERHYFRNRLVKSFDFGFGFCIPNSKNTWDAVYQLPPLDDDLIREMVENPYATTSDSYYFVGDKLVMHNKASYRYTVEDRAQSKRSYDRESKVVAGGAALPLDDKAQAKGGDGSGTAAKGTGGGGLAKAEGKAVGRNDGPWSKAEDYE